jgi:[ribosomal protein S18]-alanine N-acetyltransferase
LATFDRYIKSTRIAYAMAVQSLPRQWQVYDDFTAVEQFPVTNLSLRYMTLDDIPQVVEIDRLSFDTPWSARSYAYEIEESHYSHMLVMEADVVRAASGWKKLLRSFSGTINNLAVEKTIVGYGGLWNIMDEAHVSTIATHPYWRGRGWGEILLAAMIRRSLTLEAGYIVLEVRVSNTVAQNLYRKYEFETVDLRPSYYRNNNEDAYDMRLHLPDEGMKRRFGDRWKQLLEQYDFMDTYTNHEVSGS